MTPPLAKYCPRCGGTDIHDFYREKLGGMDYELWHCATCCSQKKTVPCIWEMPVTTVISPEVEQEKTVK